MLKIFKQLLTIPITLYYSFSARIMLYRLKTNRDKYNSIYTKRVLYNVCVNFGKALIKIAGYKPTVVHPDRLNNLKNTVVISSHALMYDPLVVSLMIKQKLVWISKKELHDSIITGPIFNVGNGLAIDRNDPSQASITLFKAARRFKKGEILAVCPEGTRSRSEKMLPFKVDIFKFLKAIKADILPIKVNYKLNQRNFNGTKNTKMILVVNKKIPYESIKHLKPEEITKMVFDIMNNA